MQLIQKTKLERSNQLLSQFWPNLTYLSWFLFSLSYCTLLRFLFWFDFHGHPLLNDNDKHFDVCSRKKLQETKEQRSKHPAGYLLRI